MAKPVTRSYFFLLTRKYTLIFISLHMLMEGKQVHALYLGLKSLQIPHNNEIKSVETLSFPLPQKQSKFREGDQRRINLYPDILMDNTPYTGTPTEKAYTNVILLTTFSNTIYMHLSTAIFEPYSDTIIYQSRFLRM